MERFELKYRSFGERSILVEWPQKIDENILKDIILFKNRLVNDSIESMVDVSHTYNSLLICYSVTIENFYDAFKVLKTIYSSKYSKKIEAKKLWRIPVCYDPVFASDLDNYTAQKRLEIEEVIRLHTSSIYTVYFIGFLPGFLYLGGLDKRLHFPRKDAPSLTVKKGAVAIGGKQTGVYPQNSPGGWHVIGNTPLNFFEANKEAPCFATSGDKLQFYQVNSSTYNDIRTLVDAGVYQMESEVLDD